MKLQKLLLLIAVMLIIVLTTNIVLADVWVNVWYGNLDGSPIEANIGELVDIDIYIQTSEETYVGDIHLCLGTQDRYVDSLLSLEYGEYYYPFTEWDTLFFYEPFGSPPNPEGWSSQSVVAICEFYAPFESPAMHFVDPTLALKMVVKTVNDSSLLGGTYDCLGHGVHPFLGYLVCGDTCGMVIPLTEYYSPIYISDGTDIGNENQDVPREYGIFQNYPNPFNAITSFEYGLPEDSHVTIIIYDLLGHQVATLISQHQSAGHHQVSWDAGANSSGIYFYRIQAGDFVNTKKMVLLK